MENGHQNGNTQGGQGGKELTPNLIPVTQTSDTRLLEKAIRQRWPIPAEARTKIPQMLLDIADNPEASHRNKVAAARALLSADTLNLEEEKRQTGEANTLNVNVRVQDMTDEQLDDCIAELTRKIGGSPGGTCSPNGNGKH